MRQRPRTRVVIPAKAGIHATAKVIPLWPQVPPHRLLGFRLPPVLVFDAQPVIPRHPEDACGSPAPFTRADLGPLALLLACVVAMFWRVLFTPAMFFYRDVFNYSYPHARFIQEVCRQGLLPYWNPYLNYGEPVLANPNFLFFYPSTLLLVLLPIALAYTLHYVIHFALAGVGTYGLARRWGQSHHAAFFAGFVFAFSGPVLSLGNLYNHAAAAAWIPWALLLTDVALASIGWRAWILLTLVFTLQSLASEPFTLIATFLLCLALALFQVGDFRRPLTGANLRIGGLFGVVGMLMIALTSVQLLPALSLLSNSRRGVEGLPFNETTSWSFHPVQLLEFIIPGFFGSTLDTPTLWTLVLSNRNMPYYLSIFVGFIPLFFALVGGTVARDRRRRFASYAAVTLLVLSLGRFTPIFAFVYLLIPPLGLVRFPAKLLVPMLVFVAVLAGWGLDVLRSDSADGRARRRITWPLAGLFGLTVIFWLASMVMPDLIGSAAGWILLRTNQMFLRSPASELTSEQVAGALQFFVRMVQLHLPGLAGFALGGWLLIVALGRKVAWARRVIGAVAFLGLGHLAWVNSFANPTVPRSFYTYRPPVLSAFSSTGQPYRFAYIFREPEAPQRAPDVQSFVNFDSIPEARELPPRAEIPFRDRLVLARATMLTETEGVSNIDVERSFPSYLYDFWVFALKGLPDPARAACLLGRTNARYQVLPSREATPTLREVTPIFNGSPAPHYLYENLCATPRAFVAGRASRLASTSEILTQLSDPGFDPTTETLVSSGAPELPVAGATAPRGEVELVERQPNSVTLRARLARPGYVVLLDRFDPNWHAAIDGREVDIFRANQLFRGVYCPAGEHEIRFTYRQEGLKTGLVVSLATLSLLGFLYWRNPRPRGPITEHPESQVR